MNENPAGTPNLGPAPGGTPVANQATTASPVVQGQPSDVVGANPTAPATVEPVKKNKTGLIIGIIIAVIALIGVATAAALILPKLGREDAVSLAMQKILTGNAPTNVAIDGEFNYLISQEGSPIKRININLDTDIMVGSMINTSSAVLTFTTFENKDYSVKFNEIYAADGNIYFKVDGATAALEDSGILDLIFAPTVQDCSDEITDCSGVAECETGDCVETLTDETLDADTKAETSGIIDIVEPVDGVRDEGDHLVAAAVGPGSGNVQLQHGAARLEDIVEVVDGVWIRVSSDSLSSTDDSSILKESPISCVTDFVTTISKNFNVTADLYNKYPFITSTTKDVIIPSKNSQVYLIGVDNEKLAGFLKAMQNPDLVDDLCICLGYDDSEELDEVLNDLPKVYAEINGDNNFSRLYLESELDDGAATLTIDLGFEYPSNVNVTEPVDYTDFTEVIQQFFSGFYELSDTEPTQVEVEK